VKTAVSKLFLFFASLKTAIPLLVLTVAVTIIGSLQPDTDYYRTWWYLGLLGLNGVSLLFITILHIPSILMKKGRNALIGVVATHLGILILIAGAIYGGLSGFRQQVKAVEGEMTVVPGLPFVIRLDELTIEEYPDDVFAHMNLEQLPKKRQDSKITLFRGGEPWQEVLAAPGSPAKAEGFTILPSISDVGRYFELRVIDPRGELSMVPVRPWAPPLVKVGRSEVMVHSLMDVSGLQAQVFTIRDDGMAPLGTIGEGLPPLDLEGYKLSLGAVKRYTGLTVYNRPHGPVLVIGSLALLCGLIWHFYFRHRDRQKEKV
jgi:cytochrome c biogenesis protein ResB